MTDATKKILNDFTLARRDALRANRLAERAQKVNSQLSAELARAIEAFQTVCEQKRAMLEALQAFLACEGIPPTQQFQHAHRLALAAVARVVPQPGKV